MRVKILPKVITICVPFFLNKIYPPQKMQEPGILPWNQMHDVCNTWCFYDIRFKSTVITSLCADFVYHLGTDGGAACEANGKASSDWFDSVNILSNINVFLFYSFI